ncbi:MAG: cyclase family protein [Anaerolineae bacterium]
MTLFDISRALNPRLAVWPGDTPFSLTQTLDRRRGDAVNLTTLTLSAHTGAHVDAPHHVADDALTVEALDLHPYWGRAQVVTVSKASGPLAPADFAPFEVGLAPRLLVHSAASHVGPAHFPRQIVFPSPELAAWLGSLGIILYGTDAPSMDAVDSKTLPGHNALLKHGIAILEGLDLSRAPDGLYELSALPLKIEGGDGSPVRAALRSAGD